MKRTYIKAANKKHFESLKKDYRAIGYNFVTFGKRLVEMEKDDDFIIIEY